ncbi:beta-mannosidase [Chelativorans sp. M5D2P16]|uniref:glycoside hydrolase family 26 protein n=1 Tax=Chelativorans sp. M5D2P16 TaxID=3095678 RepID=UPI002ACA5E60|nr:beta-mannosidase [Chelativorans sp. M5D2P16]MDZ5698800.1 beta-mannosidase [Chelativorans sp. M5D2P16]
MLKRIAIPFAFALCLGMTGMGSAEPVQGIDRMRTTAIAPDEPADGRAPLFGVYDPHGGFHHSEQAAIEHVFVYWQALDKAMLARKMHIAAQRGRVLMVTVEPYTKAVNWRDGGERLFEEIQNGRFDAEIASVCGAVASFPGRQWVRWGHEMEEPSERYPWARKDARGYIAAYRYFVASCRRIAPRARFIWSPKGQRHLAAYYPGDAHVDMVGVSIWGLEAWDRHWYGRPRGFAETLQENYRRVVRFGKPIVIAELGVAGTEDYRRRWLSEMLDPAGWRRSFPLLEGIVYFNDKEPYYWPYGYGSPDWRIAASAVADLRQASAR